MTHRRAGIILAVCMFAAAIVPGEPEPQAAESTPEHLTDCPEPERFKAADPITGEPTWACRLLDSYGLAAPELAHLNTTHKE